MVPYLILLVALTLLHREFSHMRWEELSRALSAYGWERFSWATLLLFLSFVAWSAYDWTSLQQLGRKVPYVQIFRTTFVAFPITNLVGYSVLTGIATRLRRYERLGISMTQISKLMLFNLSTWWIGVFFLGGLGLTLRPDGHLFRMSDGAVRGLGVALLTGVGAYLLVNWCSKSREFYFGRLHMHFPTLKIGLMKISVSVADNLIVGSILFAFLPSVAEISFARFMTYFLSAMIIALLSFVPAGWGVLETVLLYLFRPYVSDMEILAALVMFRLFRYLIPVTLALSYVAVRRLRSHSFALTEAGN